MDRVFSPSLESLLFTSFSAGVACARRHSLTHSSFGKREAGVAAWLLCLCVWQQRSPSRSRRRRRRGGGGGVQTVILLADILRLSPKGEVDGEVEGDGARNVSALRLFRESQSVSSSAERSRRIREGRGLRYVETKDTLGEFQKGRGDMESESKWIGEPSYCAPRNV